MAHSPHSENWLRTGMLKIKEHDHNTLHIGSDLNSAEVVSESDMNIIGVSAVKETRM